MNTDNIRVDDPGDAVNEQRLVAKNAHHGWSWAQIKALRPNSKARAFEAYHEAVKSVVSANGTEVQEVNRHFADASLRALAQAGAIDMDSFRAVAPFLDGRDVATLQRDVGGAAATHVNATMANLSVQYANDDYIGDVLVPVLNVAKKSDSYFIYPKREGFEFPDDSISSTGEPNEITKSRAASSYTAIDRSLQEKIPVTELSNQDAPLDEFLDAQLMVSEGLAFRREIRKALLLTTPGNFSGNTSTPGDTWNSTGGGDPVADIQLAIAALFRGPGASKLYGYCSLDVFNVLSRHLAMRDLFKYVAPGLATPTMLAQFFGLDDIMVGAARKQTANASQTASYSRIWGDHFGVCYAGGATVRNATFAKDFRWLNDSNAQILNLLEGVAGVWHIKSGYSNVSKTVAPTSGYLLTDVLT